METNNELLDYLHRHSQSMGEFLRQLAFVESPSAEPESQGPVLDILSESLVEMGYVVHLIPGRKSGGHLTRDRGSSAGGSVTGRYDSCLVTATLYGRSEP